MFLHNSICTTEGNFIPLIVVDKFLNNNDDDDDDNNNNNYYLIR